MEIWGSQFGGANLASCTTHVNLLVSSKYIIGVHLATDIYFEAVFGPLWPIRNYDWEPLHCSVLIWKTWNYSTPSSSCHEHLRLTGTYKAAILVTMHLNTPSSQELHACQRASSVCYLVVLEYTLICSSWMAVCGCVWCSFTVSTYIDSYTMIRWAESE